MKKLVLLFFFCFGSLTFAQEAKSYKIATVAFYNVENLFDTINDPAIFDEDRTPEGKDKWTSEKYRDKLQKLAQVMADIGFDETGTAPAIIGLSEIENRQVLEDLVDEPALRKYNYGIAHYNSPDRRGIDVALLYKQDIFKIKNTASLELDIKEIGSGNKVYTRDQLVVSGYFDGEEMHFLVNHWPSRSGGEKRSSYRREAAAALNRRIIDSLQHINPYAKIITLGDFNDNPSNRSLRKVLKAKNEAQSLQRDELFNPMAAMEKKGYGTSAYRDNWSVFDQIILSQPLMDRDFSSYKFFKAGIFSKKYLFTTSGQYRGYPFRSYGWEGYTGGYSDHFPVYAFLIKEIAD